MTETTPISRLVRHGDIAILKINSPPVNALGHAVRLGLLHGIEEALASADVAALVILCEGRTFFAGADIAEFGRPFEPPELNDLFALLDAAQKPVIAAIHGTALGGGFELALSCHYRIAVPSAKVGLPEVLLGLLPGAGGTQRTPRLAGFATTLDLIMSGKPIGASKAQSIGLIDSLADEGKLEEQAIAYARKLVAERAPLRRTRDLKVDNTPAEAEALIDDYRQKNPKLFVGFKAPANIAQALLAAASLPFEAGMEREHALFLELLHSQESVAQRHIFFAERATTKIPGLPDTVKPRTIGSVAVIGAGTMGTGIATAFLNAGVTVTLIDLNPDALGKSADRIANTMTAAAEKGRITSEEANRRTRLLRTAGTIDAISDADLVIEAVFEKLELKQEVFRQIDRAARADTILATNTSFLDVDAIAAVTGRPEHVVGLHFFAPANIMRLLEVVRGAKTSDEVLVTAMGLGRLLGKVPVMSRVCDGFIANRLMAQRGFAADRIILDGPMPWDVDKAMSDFGFPMGVFAMLDLVGLDVIGWDRDNSASRTVQEVLCEEGRWGQKRGGGYYDYDDRRRPSPSPHVEQVIARFANAGADKSRYSQREIVEQLLDPVVNEGAKLLEEGIALRASDIDVALVTGYGWPVYSGGPMCWADGEGLARIVARLKARRDAGDPITVSPLLARLAAEGGSFTQG